MLALMPKDVDREGARRFVDALGESTAAVWLAAGEVARRAVDARAQVRDMLYRRAEFLGVYEDFWGLADCLDTAAWYVLPEWCRSPRNAADSATRRHVMDAARLAAYAVLLRAHIADADFELVSAPFQDMIARVLAA